MQIFKKIALSCCLLLMIVLTGCGASKEATLIGKWKVRASSVPANNPIAAKMMESVNVEFRADKTYIFNMVFPMEGTWTVDDAGMVTLKPTKIMGQDVSKMPANAANAPALQLNASDSTLSFQPPAGTAAPAQGNLVFEKA